MNENINLKKFEEFYNDNIEKTRDYNSSLNNAEIKIKKLNGELKKCKDMIKKREEKIHNLQKSYKILLDKRIQEKEKNRKIRIQITKEKDFLIKRVKQLFGHQGYIEIYNTVEAPRGPIDHENYKKVNNIEETNGLHETNN